MKQAFGENERVLEVDGKLVKTLRGCDGVPSHQERGGDHSNMLCNAYTKR